GKVQMLSQDEKKGEFTLYMVLDFPFPLKDRDVVVKGKMSKAAPLKPYNNVQIDKKSA
ncbi:hypothetical protein HN302_20350, partial [Acinetobacter baumannii]|nr:hypothetical protein [Acinetobacter baumannii]